MEFEISGGMSIEVFDDSLIKMRDRYVVYRVTVSSFDNADLKMIVGSRTKMLTAHARNWSVDVAVAGQFFLEVAGKGTVRGTYEALFGM